MRFLTPTPAKWGKSTASFPFNRWPTWRRQFRRTTFGLGLSPVPADSAQDVADQLVGAAGCKGILNFAPVSITVPADVAPTAVDLAVQLEQLSFQVNFAGTVTAM